MMPCANTPATDPPATPRRPQARLLWLVPILLSMLLVTVGCQTRDNSWARVQESGVLRVGIDPTYPPFAVGLEDGVAGLDVELATALAADLGLEPRFTYFGYDGLYDALLTNQVDVLISALVVDPDRTRNFVYSAPYYDAGQVLVVGSEDYVIKETADLENSTIAVELGALGHVEALAAARRVPGLQVETFGSADEALDAAADGTARAALVDSISVRQYLLNNSPDAPAPLRWLAPSVSSEPFAIVLRNDDQELLDQLNGALQSLIDAGLLESLIQQWVGP